MLLYWRLMQVTLRSVLCYMINIYGSCRPTNSYCKLYPLIFVPGYHTLTVYGYLCLNTTLDRYDYKHANVLELIKNININININKLEISILLKSFKLRLPVFTNHKISSQSVHNFLSNVHRQTNKQTNRQTD